MSFFLYLPSASSEDFFTALTRDYGKALTIVFAFLYVIQRNFCHYKALFSKFQVPLEVKLIKQKWKTGKHFGNSGIFHNLIFSQSPFSAMLSIFPAEFYY